MPTSQGFRDLKVYQLAFRLAMVIFQASKNFPSEERYSLTDQSLIRRDSAPNVTSHLVSCRLPSVVCLSWPRARC